MEKRLIVNADDFGYSDGINQGVVYCFKSGIVTDTSMIMNMDHTDDAIKLAKLNKLSVGVHLNIATGRSLASPRNIRSIIKNNEFYDIYRLIKRFMVKRVNINDVEREFRLQIERLINNKIRPSHLDTHKFTQILPGVLEVVVKLSKEYDINRVRCCYERWSFKLHKAINSNFFTGFSKLQFIKSRFVSTMSKNTKHFIRMNHVKCPDNFFGVSQLNSGDPLTSLKNMIKIVESNTEIMCHPGYFKNDLSRDFYTYQREEELKALTSKELKDLIRQYDIKLISYNDL